MANGDEDLRKELDALRAQVQALAGARENAPVAPPPRADASPAPDGPSPEDDSGGPVDFDGLIEALKHEVEDLPAMTTLAVFTLGILVGRLLTH